MDEKQIDSYLFNEMSEAEREEFEDRFVGDDDVFAEIAERENELVDAYVRGALRGAELERFERSLEALPARRQKVANANVISEFVASERENKTITIAERSGFSAKLAEFFTFRSPAFQFASIGAILLLALVSVYLLLENRRLGSLQKDLADARGREIELASQVENERDVAGDLTTDLNAERERIAELEKEIAKLRGSGHSDQPANVAPPTIATLILSPAIRRDGGPPLAKRLELGAGVTRVSIVINLPAETGDQVSVRLNGEKIAEALRVGSRKGEKNIAITVPVARLKSEMNELEVVDPTGQVTAAHKFSISRK